jgi:HEAT repeat protein
LVGYPIKTKENKMRWILIFVVLLIGIYFFFSRKQPEKQPLLPTVQQVKEDLTEVLPAKKEKSRLIKFSPQTIKTLRSLTNDTNEKVRFAAVELLWQMQDENTPAIIKEMLESETEQTVKFNIIKMLGEEKSRISLSLLAKALDNYDKDTRLKAIEAISTFSNKEVLPVLNKALKDYDEEIRLKALESINRIRKDIETHKEQQLEKTEKMTPIFRIQ